MITGPIPRAACAGDFVFIHDARHGERPAGDARTFGDDGR